MIFKSNMLFGTGWKWKIPVTVQMTFQIELIAELFKAESPEQEKN